MSEIIFVLLGIHFVSGLTYKTCLDALNKGESANKSYDMVDSGGYLFKVYCEFGLSGGYTFISNFMLSADHINISNIIPNDTTSVLFRMMLSNGSQTESFIEQLPGNNKIPLGIFLTKHGNYEAPISCPPPYNRKTPSYLYIGFLSMSDTRGHTRGYMANGNSYKTVSSGQSVSPCYFSIYFSPVCLSGITIKKLLPNSTMSGWYESSRPVGPNKLPSEFFFQSYLVNCRGRADLVTYNSYEDTELAVGLPFAFSSPRQSTSNSEQTTLHRTTEEEVTTDLTTEPYSTKVTHHRFTEVIQPHTAKFIHPKTTYFTHPNTTYFTHPNTTEITNPQESTVHKTSMSQYPAGFSPTPPGSTISNECTCVCPNRYKYIYLAGRNLTMEEIKSALQSELKKLKSSIEVPKKNTSAYIRSKTCDTSDKRVSSKAIGSLSIVTIVVPLVLFLLNDAVNVCHTVKKKRVIPNE